MLDLTFSFGFLYGNKCYIQYILTSRSDRFDYTVAYSIRRVVISLIYYISSYLHAQTIFTKVIGHSLPWIDVQIYKFVLFHMSILLLIWSRNLS